MLRVRAFESVRDSNCEIAPSSPTDIPLFPLTSGRRRIDDFESIQSTRVCCTVASAFPSTHGGPLWYERDSRRLDLRLLECPLVEPVDRDRLLTTRWSGPMLAVRHVQRSAL